MQPEQDANIAALVCKGFAMRVPKSKNPSEKVQAAIAQLLHDEVAKQKAAEFAKVMEKWYVPKWRQIFSMKVLVGSQIRIRGIFAFHVIPSDPTP
jgi:hypothetical protein